MGVFNYILLSLLIILIEKVEKFYETLQMF